MTTSQMFVVLAALGRERLATILRRLGAEPRSGRPWSVRELAASFGVARSAAHRILATMTPQRAALLPDPALRDRRDGWDVDGTLVPTRDHCRTARSKNYRHNLHLDELRDNS